MAKANITFDGLNILIIESKGYMITNRTGVFFFCVVPVRSVIHTIDWPDMLLADDPTVIPLGKLYCRQSMKHVQIMWVADRNLHNIHSSFHAVADGQTGVCSLKVRP